MKCCIADMRYKEVINVCNGQRLGYVCDIEINIKTGQVVALIVPGPYRFLGLFGREEDFLIPWDCIDRIGEDIIIISIDGECPRKHREKRRSSFK